MFEKELAMLEHSKGFETEDIFDEFEHALELILVYKDPECIPLILQYLSDDGDYPEMMYQIIHSVESFPLEDDLRGVFKVLSQIYEKAPDFTKTLIYRVLNEKNTQKKFREMIEQDEEKAQAIKPILISIAQDSENHKEICNEILLKID